MTKYDWKLLLVKAANTWWQAFVVAFYLPAQSWSNFSAWQAAVIAAAAAGLSALKGFIVAAWTAYQESKA